MPHRPRIGEIRTIHVDLPIKLFTALTILRDTPKPRKWRAFFQDLLDKDEQHAKDLDYYKIKAELAETRLKAKEKDFEILEEKLRKLQSGKDL